MVGGIAVVPHDPEVGSGDGEALDGLVRAVRSGDPADDRGPDRVGGHRHGGGRRLGLRRELVGSGPPCRSGFGLGTTSACCCTGAERGGGVSALRSAGSRPSLGSGEASFAPAGLCPIGRLNGASRDGLGISKAWVARGCAAAAAPSHGSAFAGGATPSATLSPMTVSDATDSDAIRGRGDMSHLSRAGRRSDVSS